MAIGANALFLLESKLSFGNILYVSFEGKPHKHPPNFIFQTVQTKMSAKVMDWFAIYTIDSSPSLTICCVVAARLAPAKDLQHHRGILQMNASP